MPRIFNGCKPLEKIRYIRALALLFFVGIVILSLNCEEPPAFEGEGGILDSPMSIVVRGNYAYVINANFDQSQNGDGWIAVIDIAQSLVNRKDCIIYRMFMDPFISDMVINKAGTLAYIANRKKQLVSLVDLTDPTKPELLDLDPIEDGHQGIQTGIEPVGLALSLDESLLFVACVGSGDLSIIDTEKQTLIKNIDLGWGINTIVPDPTGKYIWVSNKGVNAVYIVEIATGNFLASFAVGDPHTDTDQDLRGMTFSADGKFAYVAASDPPSLMVIDVDKLPYYPNQAVLKYIPMDSSPAGVTLSPDGKEIWVANFSANSIYVVDAQTNDIIDFVWVGLGPYKIAFSEEDPRDPGHYWVYTANFASHNLSLLDSQTKDYIWAIP